MVKVITSACLLGWAVQAAHIIAKGEAAAIDGACRKAVTAKHSIDNFGCSQCPLAFATSCAGSLVTSPKGSSSSISDNSGSHGGGSAGLDCHMTCTRMTSSSNKLNRMGSNDGNYLMGESLCNGYDNHAHDGWKAEDGCYGYGCYYSSAVTATSVLVAPPLPYGYGTARQRSPLCGMRMALDGVAARPVAAPTTTATKIGGGDKLQPMAAEIPVQQPEKRVLILMSDTGGGHRASAMALQDAFNEIFPGKIQTKIVDIWTEYSAWPFNKAVSTYKYLARHPRLWKLSYDYGRFPLTNMITNIWTNLTSHKRFRQCFEESAPDLIISVHPLCQNLPMKVLQKMSTDIEKERAGTIGGKMKNMNRLKLNGSGSSSDKKDSGNGLIPFVTVVTDLGSAHPTWFDQRVDACYVPSPVLEKQALRKGLSKEKVHLEGLPLRSHFWDKGNTPKTELQRQLGLIPGAPTALVVGGGDGVGRIADIAQHLSTRLAVDVPGSQLVVVCGNNKEVKEKLEAHKWPEGINVVVKGFASNINEWMEAADLLVTKAGPGTIAEAATKGLPLILSSFLPGQEKGNVPYVVKGGFGVYKKRPRAIAKVASEWLRDPAKLAAMRQAALLHGNPNATKDIVASIGRELLFA